MVPSYSLIRWSGVVLVSCAIAVATVPGLLLGAACIVIGFAVLVLADAARGNARIRPITVQLPPDLRLTKDREGNLPVTIAQDPAEVRQIRMGIAWPAPLHVEAEAIGVALAAQPQQRFLWTVLPRERGDFPIDSVYLECPSPLGFWCMRAARSTACQVRVYPNLQPERKQLAAIFLNRGGLGGHARRQVGKGREFEKLREWLPGDGYEDIHWKATARRGFPITKDYQIERTQEVYVVLDASRLSARVAPGTQPDTVETALERMIQAAMTMGLVAEKQGDHFGLLTFSDGIHTFLRARNGKTHFNAMREALYRLQPRPVNPDYDEVASFIRLRLRRRALVVFLTNLDDPVLSENFAAALRLITRRHLVMANTITPQGMEPLFAHDDVASVGDVYRKLAGHLQWHDLQELRQGLHRQGVTLHLTSHASLAPELVSQYMDVKRRQTL